MKHNYTKQIKFAKVLRGEGGGVWAGVRWKGGKQERSQGSICLEFRHKRYFNSIFIVHYQHQECFNTIFGRVIIMVSFWNKRTCRKKGVPENILLQTFFSVFNFSKTILIVDVKYYYQRFKIQFAPWLPLASLQLLPQECYALTVNKFSKTYFRPQPNTFRIFFNRKTNKIVQFSGCKLLLLICSTFNGCLKVLNLAKHSTCVWLFETKSSE